MKSLPHYALNATTRKPSDIRIVSTYGQSATVETPSGERQIWLRSSKSTSDSLLIDGWVYNYSHEPTARKKEVAHV